ncbi:hypothetical protein Dimus_029127 [Dionaea muscipula]
MEEGMVFIGHDIFFDGINKQMISSSMEIEDDALYADLDRQISLLIMDDDDHDSSPVFPHSASFQSIPESVKYPSVQSPIYYQQRSESKGTGVFIPRSSHPRRKTKHGKHGSQSTKSSRHQIVNPEGISHHVAHPNSPSYSCDYLNRYS